MAFVAQTDGSDWAVTLEPLTQPTFSPVKLQRDDSAGPAVLTAALAGASGVFWIDDPAVGDKIGVVTALGPPKGLPTKRDFVQFSLLQSAQGLGVESHADDLAVAYNGDIVTLSTPKGLSLSPANARMASASAINAPGPAAQPGLFGPDWAQTGASGYLARYDALMAPVADEEGKGLEGPTSGHMALARFLIGSEGHVVRGPGRPERRASNPPGPRRRKRIPGAARHGPGHGRPLQGGRDRSGRAAAR